MKDRYLFRGKRVDNGEWVYGDLITILQSSPIIYEDFDRTTIMHPVIDETACQSTGLCDINGTAVFESDKVHSHRHNFDGIVSWIKGSFMVREINPPEDNDYHGVWSFDPELLQYEIIGTAFYEEKP